MPLSKGKSKKAFSHNVSAEMHAGKPQAQALAIAYSVKRHAMRKKMAHGGEVENEKLHPGSPLKSSLAEHLLHKMSAGGIVPENEDHETLESDRDGDDFLASPPEQPSPEAQGMAQHEIDTYPPSHEFESEPGFEEKRKKLSAAFASMADKRRRG